MVGITAYGAHIPWYRMSHDVICSAMGWMKPSRSVGERAVANCDEDSITMAVAAATDCLAGICRESVDGLYFATTTQPYLTRQNAGIVAAALDLGSNTRTVDFTGATKVGTGGLVLACDAVRGEGSNKVLLCASDCRLGKPGGSQEYACGDGAAALLLGSGDNVIAALESVYSTSHDFMDRWRMSGEKFEHLWEDRWIRDAGYAQFIPEVISGLLEKCNLNIKDVAKIIYPCPYAKLHAAIGKDLGATPGQIQDPLLATVGDTGSAHPLMMLIAALEDAKPGDKIVVASYGSGGDALLFSVTDNIDKMRGRRGFKENLARREALTSYEKYIAFRNILPVEVGVRGEQIAFTQISTLWRENKAIFSLCGSKCKRCGTPQYPAQRICVNPDCGAVDEMEEYRFSDKKGTLIAYTGDNLAFCVNPPAIYGVADFDGGGRFWFDITDCNLDVVKVGMPVELTFRRKYLDEAHGICGYFWKAVPLSS
ncbi:MAG: hydroxymethylglutaryl-CoA synthase family protein [Dehalococcoidia bacterium]|nr:hydroxymethylglutaryl-CoA synthase family protein [Dehalococcoidia bacterium]